MYFDSRAQAGKLLAEKIVPKYRYENCAVVALSDGAVVVAAQIAQALHCVLTMLLTEAIHLPGEHDALASVNTEGGFIYNNMFSAGQIEEYKGDYNQYIEEKRREKLSELHRLLGSGGLIRKDLLKGHNVILVADGLSSGMSLDAAAYYLKPINIEKLIVATPFASVPAVDRMHLVADEIYCLNVLENYMNTDHYYEDNSIPDHQTIIKTIQDIVLLWH